MNDNNETKKKKKENESCYHTVDTKRYCMCILQLPQEQRGFNFVSSTESINQ